MIEVVINGETRRVEPGHTLESLLSALGLPAERVAVERNRRVVPRRLYSAEPVEAGDRLEVVTLVGGG